MTDLELEALTYALARGLRVVITREQFSELGQFFKALSFPTLYGGFSKESRSEDIWVKRSNP